MKSYIQTNVENLDKVQKYLDEHHVPYVRNDSKYDKDHSYRDRHQIQVFSDADQKYLIWDVICHPGSYGWERGELEVMGVIVPNRENCDLDCDDHVKGYLSADDVISMCNAYYGFESL